MIQCLDSGEALQQARVVALDVLHELVLLATGAGDQDRTGAAQGKRCPVQELLILGGVSAADGVGFVVDVLVRMPRTHDFPIELVRVEMKDPCLVMIDPDDRMIVLGHAGTPEFCKVAYAPGMLHVATGSGIRIYPYGELLPGESRSRLRQAALCAYCPDGETGADLHDAEQDLQ